MALAFRHAEPDEPLIADINVTPLVDVCLVLVIIFMAVAPFAVQAGIKVLQSKAGVQVGKVAESDAVSLTLSRDGSVKLDGKAVAAPLLAERLRLLLESSEEKMVVVRADDENLVGEVVALLDEAKQAGAAKLAILKAEPSEGGS